MKKGFTLMEIICTLAVISIILLITAPSVTGYVRKDRLKIATDEIVNDLRYAKMHAVSKAQTDVTVEFKKSQESIDGFDYYALSFYENGTKKEIKKVSLPMRVRICSRVDGSTFDMTNRIVFQPAGNVSPFACTVAVKDIDTGKKENITLTIGYTRIMRVVK